MRRLLADEPIVVVSLLILGGAAMAQVPDYLPDAEKSIADCFKYRNKIGLDVALEAIAAYTKRPGSSVQRIFDYARINRVHVKIRPYLEAAT